MALCSRDPLDVMMPMVRCAKCNKPVDRIERQENFERDTLVFKVWCHGDTDTCELTHLDLVRFGNKLEPGYAFTTERIPEATAEGVRQDGSERTDDDAGMARRLTGPSESRQR